MLRQERIVGWGIVVLGVWLVAAAGFVPRAALAADKAAKVPELNQQVVQFCKDNLGKKVDNGECAMLVIRAYEAVGAKTPEQLPAPKPPMVKDDYVWGRLLGADDEVLPGDVIQFRDVQIKTVFPDRSWKTASYPHHTAVVYEVKGKQKFVILQQNSGGNGKTEEQKKVVQKDTLDLAGKQKGTVWIYRPLPK